MNKTLRYFILVLFLFSSFLYMTGCTTLTLDLSQINAIDGVDRSEAVILAQSNLANSIFKHKMKVAAPFVHSATETAQYLGYWFISFRPQEYLVWEKRNYLVVIDKNSGLVVYAGLWDKSVNPDFKGIIK